MAKILNLFRWRRDRLERDLDRELRYHMDRRVDDMMKNGLSEAEARRQASIEFGGVAQVQEEVRDTWIWRWLDALVLDVRYAIRGLVKSWGFALGTGAVLALGHRRHHRHLLGGQYGVAAAARLPGRRAHRLGRDVLDQHRTRQPGRVRSRLSRLAGAERRVREDGGVVRQHRRRHHRRRPRRVCQRAGTSRPISLRSSARPRRRDAC